MILTKTAAIIFNCKRALNTQFKRKELENIQRRTMNYLKETMTF